jgi:hypothetical protein
MNSKPLVSRCGVNSHAVPSARDEPKKHTDGGRSVSVPVLAGDIIRDRAHSIIHRGPALSRFVIDLQIKCPQPCGPLILGLLVADSKSKPMAQLG